MAQTQANILARKNQIKSAPVNAAKVCDGVSIGLRMAACRVERPWLVPHNLDSVLEQMTQDSAHPGKTVNKSAMHVGTKLNKYTMITNQKIRPILHDLAHSKPVTPAQEKTLREWIDSNRPQLKPYVKTKAVSAPNACGMLCQVAHCVWTECSHNTCRLTTLNSF